MASQRVADSEVLAIKLRSVAEAREALSRARTELVRLDGAMADAAWVPQQLKDATRSLINTTIRGIDKNGLGWVELSASNGSAPLSSTARGRLKILLRQVATAMDRVNENMIPIEFDFLGAFQTVTAAVGQVVATVTKTVAKAAATGAAEVTKPIAGALMPYVIVLGLVVATYYTVLRKWTP